MLHAQFTVDAPLHHGILQVAYLLYKFQIFSLVGWFCIVIGCSDEGLFQSIAWLMLHGWLRFTWPERGGGSPGKVRRGLSWSFINHCTVHTVAADTCGQPHGSCGQWSLPGPQVPCLADSSSLMQPANQSITRSFHSICKDHSLPQSAGFYCAAIDCVVSFQSEASSSAPAMDGSCQSCPRGQSVK